ncbi:hypothetical protein AcW2_005792 [Taiwanofungus camphoratus]|nr:hypothetical protein AcW2_005792 [Antrodia cinnamomea]
METEGTGKTSPSTPGTPRGVGSFRSEIGESGLPPNNGPEEEGPSEGGPPYDGSGGPQEDRLVEEDCPVEEDRLIREDHLGEEKPLGENPLEGGSLLEEHPSHKKLHEYPTERSQRLLNSLENMKMPGTSSSSLPEDSTRNNGPPPLNERRALEPHPLIRGVSWGYSTFRNVALKFIKRFEVIEEEVSASIGLRNLVYTYDKPIADFNEEFNRLAHRAEITEENALMA